MPRKIVQLTPLKIHDYAGVYLFAVCNDGTAWRAVQNDDGSIAGEWMPIPPVNDDDPLRNDPQGRIRD